MKHERFGFYCERKDDPGGRVDTLRLDFTDRTYKYIALLDRSQLGKGYYGDALPEVPVNRGAAFRASSDRADLL